MPPTLALLIAQAAPPAVGRAWLWQVVTSGGPLGIAITTSILVVSLAAVALVAEQLWALGRERLAPDGLADRVRKCLESGDLAAAARACDQQPSLLATALRAGLDDAAGSGPAADWPGVEKAIEESAAESASALLRRIEYLALVGNLAPMLGLLGTVFGMILAFREVAASEGAATASQLASGIYQALVTTVAGLVVAIPSLGAYAVLRNRLDGLVSLAMTDAQRATRPLKRLLAASRSGGATR